MLHVDSVVDLHAGIIMSSLFGHHHSSGHETAPPPVQRSPAVQEGHIGGGPGYHQEPVAPLVTVFSEANRNYRLTSREDGVVLAYKNQHDTKQVQIHLVSTAR